MSESLEDAIERMKPWDWTPDPPLLTLPSPKGLSTISYDNTTEKWLLSGWPFGPDSRIETHTFINRLIMALDTNHPVRWGVVEIDWKIIHYVRKWGVWVNND